tara:strand:- start:1639 stop:2430 length:792 start_codon:yes stop_codon:yes gene_type:complete
MKNYLVIGNPIDHSLSPKLHNYWFKKNNINAVYDRKLLKENEIKNIIYKIKKDEVNGINVTLPFKKSVISFVDKLTPEAEETQSVNTVYKEKNIIIGHNTDIAGFELALRHAKFDAEGKKVFILGSGGVVPSIILGLKRAKVSKILLSNRTKSKAKELKKNFQEIEITNWGEVPNFDMIINATSVGLNNNDEIKIDYSSLGSNKLFFDLIYNPRETIFLKKAKLSGNRAENGKMMFIYQAHQSFTIWHKTMPTIDEEIIKLLD